MSFKDDALLAFKIAASQDVVVKCGSLSEARAMQKKLHESRRWFPPEAKAAAREITVSLDPRRKAVVLRSKITPDRKLLRRAISTE